MEQEHVTSGEDVLVLPDMYLLHATVNVELVASVTEEIDVPLVTQEDS